MFLPNYLSVSPNPTSVLLATFLGVSLTYLTAYSNLPMSNSQPTFLSLFDRLSQPTDYLFQPSWLSLPAYMSLTTYLALPTYLAASPQYAWPSLLIYLSLPTYPTTYQHLLASLFQTYLSASANLLASHLDGWPHTPSLTHLSLVCSQGPSVVLCVLYQKL